MNRLNTMDTFSKGFNIVRNGEVITLTYEEMSDFRYLEKATTGRDCLEAYIDWADEDEQDIIETMMNDEEICYNIEDDILNIAAEDIGIVETDVIRNYISRNK